MTTKHQSGFGVVPTIAIVAIVALLGFVGIRLLAAQSSKPVVMNNATANNQTTPASSQSNNTPTSATPAQADTYLHIKELGIKLKLSDGIRDATYSYTAPSSKTYALFGGGVYISTQTLTNKDAACRAENGPLGVIEKITGTVDSMDNTVTANNMTVFKFGNNFYRLDDSNVPCSANSSVNALATTQKAEFRQAFKTIQLDN